MLRGLVFVAQLILISFSCQFAKSQCYITVSKNCGDEQFTNDCGGECNESKYGQECGYYVDGDPALSYSSIDQSNELGAGSVISFLPFPRWCGVVKNCLCSRNQDLEYECVQWGFGFAPLDYWVTESQVDDFDCEDGGPPLLPQDLRESSPSLLIF